MGDFPQSDQWLTPEMTPFTTHSDFESVSTKTLPVYTAFQSQSGFSHDWHPGHRLSPGVKNYVYSAVAGVSKSEPAGLGISDSTDTHTPHITVTSYATSGGSSYAHEGYGEDLPPTPQTAGLTPDARDRSPQSSLTTGRSPNIRKPRSLRSKGPAADVGPSFRPILKRRRSSNTSQSSTRASPKNAPSAVLAERLRQDEWVTNLKKEGLTWKEIAKQHEVEFGHPIKEATLQMRRSRLKEKFRVWSDADDQALRNAHMHYEANKFDTISLLMLQFGISDRWDAKRCQKRWEELDQRPTMYYPGMSTTMAQPVPSVATPAMPIQDHWQGQEYAASSSARPSPLGSPMGAGSTQGHSGYGYDVACMSNDFHYE